MNKGLIKIVASVGLGLTALSGIAATPAMARDHYRHYDRGDYYRGYDRGDHYRGYNRGYDRGDYRDYRGRNYYRGDRYRCRDNGTGGAIIGAIAGGLLGHEVAGRGDRTTGAVLGGALGAVTGHVIDKNNGNRC